MKSKEKKQTSTSFIYHHQFGKEFWASLFFPVVGYIGMNLNAADYNQLAPYISSPHDLVNSLETWALDCAPNDDAKDWYFIFDSIFALGLLLLNAMLFFGFYNRKVVNTKTGKSLPKYSITPKERQVLPSEATIQINFNWSNFPPMPWKREKWNSVFIIFSCLLIVAFGIEMGESFCFWGIEQWQEVDSSFLENMRCLQQIKIITYGLIIAFILYQIIYAYLADRYPINSDFWQFIAERLRYLLRYFYPSLLGILILANLLNVFNVFDALLVEIFDYINFPLFLLLFAGMLLSVWFVPYYLRFSKTFYDDLLNKKEKVTQDIKCNELKLKYGKQDSTEDNICEELEKIHKAESLWTAEKENSRNVDNPPESNDLLKTIKAELAEKDVVQEYFFASDFKNLFFPIKHLPDESETNNRLAVSSPEDKKTKPEIKYGPYQTKLINGLFKETEKTTLDTSFHNLRRIIAYIFIMSLLAQEGKLLDSLFHTNYIQIGLIGSSFLFMLVFVIGYRLSLDKQSKKIISVTHLKWYRGIYTANGIVLIILLVGVVFQPAEQFLLLLLFILSTYLLPFCFVGFSLYRRITKKYQFELRKKELDADKKAKKIKEEVFFTTQFKEWGYRSLERFMPAFLLGSLAFLAFGLWGVLADINYFEWLSPLNLCLIFFNGFIALIAVTDRYLTLLKERKQLGYVKDLKIELPEISNKRLKFLTILGLYFIFWWSVSATENHYHDVDYTAHTEAQPDFSDTIMSFAQYTEQFLANRPDTTQPIIMVAADGGGLRAAYWTLLVMNKLDSLTGSSFSNQVFLCTGISGGGIGLGMYTHHRATDKDLAERMQLTERIAATNFLSGDLSGIFGKELLTYMLPSVFNFSFLEDRAEAMARHYFELQGVADYEAFKKASFHKLWATKKDSLPLLVVNTARTEDGSRGVVHPLDYKIDTLGGYVDLSSNFNGALISYPDAVFLTNRFPFFSPAGRIEGKGHFVDGGYLENSGLSTIFYYLNKLGQTKNARQKEIFKQLLKRKIIIVSINNDKESYIQSKFKHLEDSVNRSHSQAELSSIIGATASTGTAALPKFYKKLFQGPNFAKRFGIDSFDFVQIQLPYRIHANEVHQAFYGQIAACEIADSVNNHNERLLQYYTQLDTIPQFVPIHLPPLGRILPTNTREYMNSMLEFEEVQEQMRRID